MTNRISKRAVLLAFLFGITVYNAQSQKSNITLELIEKINQTVDSDSQRLKDIFKDIHKNPELGFMEVRTANIVANELKNQGFEVITGIGGTGVAGVLRNGEGPTFMFRADMDANAVKEETGLPYASEVVVTNLDGQIAPVAHMCGHDAHTTWLISLAKTMNVLKKNWSGTLVLIAQPAEEPIEGAMAMVDDGLYTKHQIPKPDYFVAFHTAPFPTGSVLTTQNRLTTGTEHIDVTFHGSGGHGSSPQHATDPVVMAGMAIVQFQTIVSRRIDPEEVSVLTIGSVQAGIDNNVIPTEATLKLKLHFSSTEVHNIMVENIERISNSIAKSYDAPESMMPTIFRKGFAPTVINNPEYIAQIREAINKTDIVTLKLEDETVPGSDDAFALIYGLDNVKGAYLFLGTADPLIFKEAQKNGKEFPFFVHEPNYQVDLNAISYGSKMAAILALDILEKK